MSTRDPILVFPTRAAAEQHLTAAGMEPDGGSSPWWQPPGRYDLRHGEYARPRYRLQRCSGGIEIRAEHSYATGTLNAPRSGLLRGDGLEPVTPREAQS